MTEVLVSYTYILFLGITFCLPFLSNIFLSQVLFRKSVILMNVLMHRIDASYSTTHEIAKEERKSPFGEVNCNEI